MNFNTWLSLFLPWFLYYKVVTLQLVVIFSFPHSVLWKWVTKSNPHSRGGQSSSTSWKGNSLHITWNYSVRTICSFSPHFQIYQSFIYSCMNSIFLKNILGYNPNSGYFAAHTVAALLTGSSFRLAPVSLWHASLLGEVHFLSGIARYSRLILYFFLSWT